MRVVPLVGLLCCSCTTPHESAASAAEQPLTAAPKLSPTRALRRVWLTLRGREPSLAQYQAALDAADAGTFDALLASEVDASLASADFEGQMLALGHDYLKVGDYKRGSTEGGLAAHFKGSHAVRLDVCAAGTLHAGALGHFSGDVSLGDPSSLCDSSGAATAMIEPWWAPGTMVQVIGRARDPTDQGGTLFITMGWPYRLEGKWRNDAPTPGFVQALTHVSQAWCRTAVLKSANTRS
jgi:hypothetical protein